MIKVLFKDTHYEPWNAGDSDCSFFINFRGRRTKKNVVEVNKYVRQRLNPEVYEEEVAGDYSFYEWVIERLCKDQIAFDVPSKSSDITVEW